MNFVVDSDQKEVTINATEKNSYNGGKCFMNFVVDSDQKEVTINVVEKINYNGVELRAYYTTNGLKIPVVISNGAPFYINIPRDVLSEMLIDLLSKIKTPDQED